jgi:hypothetical protein
MDMCCLGVVTWSNTGYSLVCVSHLCSYRYGRAVYQEMVYYL